MFTFFYLIHVKVFSKENDGFLKPVLLILQLRIKLVLSQLLDRRICIVIHAHVSCKLSCKSDFSVLSGVALKKIHRTVVFAL